MSNGVKTMIDYFKDRYKQTLGMPYPTDYAKDGKIFKRLIPLGNENLVKLIDLFFTEPPEFAQQNGFSIGIFSTSLPKLQLKLMQKRRNPPPVEEKREVFTPEQIKENQLRLAELIKSIGRRP